MPAPALCHAMVGPTRGACTSSHPHTALAGARIIIVISATTQGAAPQHLTAQHSLHTTHTHTPDITWDIWQQHAAARLSPARLRPQPGGISAGAAAHHGGGTARATGDDEGATTLVLRPLWMLR